MIRRALIAALGCLAPGVTAAQNVAEVQVAPPSVTIRVGERSGLLATAFDRIGNVIPTVRIIWSSNNLNVAKVDNNGTVTGVGSGVAIIEARVGARRGQAAIQVTGGAGRRHVDIAAIGCGERRSERQHRRALTRTGHDSREGSPLMLSPGEVDTLHVIVAAQSNRTVNPLVLQWASSDQSVARISLAGVVTAAGPGKAILTVSGLLQSKSIEVSVHQMVAKLSVRPRLADEIQVPLTSTAKFEAQALTAENVAVPEAPLRWTVADPAIASFDVQTGLLTGRAVGKTQLTVRGPGTGLSVSWNVSVIAGSVRFAQPRVGIGLNQRHTLRANYADDQGNVLGPAANLTWTSDSPQIASVGEDGTVAGAAYGHAKVTATAPGGKTATADVYVVGEILVASSRSGPNTPGKFQLYAIERSNLAQLTKLTPDTSSANDPAFSPDGSRIAFVSRRDGNAEIYVMNADGTGSTRITNDPQPDGRPAFTPDGQSLVFHSARTTGKQQIWAVNLDATGLTQLTRDSVNASPTVSPDGQTIAYVSTRNKDADIWLMARDGANQRQFTRSPQQRESEPHFLRDGTLAYLVERRGNNRPVQQGMRGGLWTGGTTALPRADLAIASFAISAGGDLLALGGN